MGEFQIKTWLDIERVLPKRWHASFRVWRVLQELNHETMSGKFVWSTTVERVASILNVTCASVKRALVAGQGVFWHLTEDRSAIYMVGYGRVYRHFGCTPQRYYPPRLVDASRIGGNIARFRAFIVGVKLANYQAARHYVEEPREKIAKAMGVSLPTLRSAAREGWIQIQLHVRVVGDVPKPKPRQRPGGVRIKPVIRLDRVHGEKIMEVDGEAKIVRQFVNLYRSVFSFGGKDLEPMWVEWPIPVVVGTVPEGWHW